MKYVSDSNLSRFFTKLKGIFAKKSEVPSQADLDAKLSLSGGTMTGNIVLSGANVGIADTGGYNVIRSSGGSINVGRVSVSLVTGVNFDVYHTKGGNQYAMLDAANTAANPTLAGTEAVLESLKINGTSYKNQPASVQYSSTAPTAANTDGIKFAVLSSEPSDKYAGWLTIIT